MAIFCMGDISGKVDVHKANSQFERTFEINPNTGLPHDFLSLQQTQAYEVDESKVLGVVHFSANELIVDHPAGTEIGGDYSLIESRQLVKYSARQ